MSSDEIPASERELIEAAQADPTLFGQLYLANLGPVFAYVFSRTRDRAAAEDLTSEVFFRALRALPRFEWRGVPYAAYLLRIADNLLRDAFSRVAAESRMDHRSEDAFLPEPAVDDGLFNLLGRLPDDQRLVLARRFADDRSIAQVAAELGRSEGAIKQLQHRALSTLRTWLADAREGRHD